jgi:hypothetical protein
MSSKNFLIYSGLLIVCNLFANRYYPQIEDFLCGCNYCESINKHEPLDVGYHMMQHQAYRDGLIKTMDIINRKPDPFGIPVRDTLPDYSRKNFSEEPKNVHKVDTTIKEPKLSIIDDPYNDYEWRYIDNHGWTYSTTIQSTTNDTWIYREDIGWVFSFGIEQNFLYSEEHGWFYTMRYIDRNILYWYDRRYWLYAHDFWWKK